MLAVAGMPMNPAVRHDRGNRILAGLDDAGVTDVEKYAQAIDAPRMSHDVAIAEVQTEQVDAAWGQLVEAMGGAAADVATRPSSGNATRQPVAHRRARDSDQSRHLLCVVPGAAERDDFGEFFGRAQRFRPPRSTALPARRAANRPVSSLDDPGRSDGDCRETARIAR